MMGTLRDVGEEWVRWTVHTHKPSPSCRASKYEVCKPLRCGLASAWGVAITLPSTSSTMHFQSL